MKVFLSHSNSETARLCAKTLRDHVEQAGLDEFLPETKPAAGTNWQSEIGKQLETSDAYVFVVDQQANRSRDVQLEWQAAVEQSWSHPEKPMIPVLVGDAELPGFLADRMAVRVGEGEPPDQAAATVVAALKRGRGAASDYKPEAEQRQRREQRLSNIAAESEKFTPSEDDVKRRLALLEQALATASARSPKSREVAELKLKLTDVLKALGRPVEAASGLEEALAILAPLEGRTPSGEIARIHANLGSLLGDQNELVRARAHWREALRRYEALDESLMQFSAHAALAALSRRLGDPEEEKTHSRALKDLLRRGVASVPFLGPILSRFFADPDEKKGP